MFDSFWRALLHSLHPRVIVLSLLPLFFMGGLAWALGYFFWDDALAAVRDWLELHAFSNTLWNWLETWAGPGLKTALAPLLVIFAITPLIVVLSLLVVVLLMTPALVSLVAEKRFAAMQRARGASFLRCVGWSLGSTLGALAAMVASIPLWAIPPLILVLPPLIWGWLTYRVMAFDALAEHATELERRTIMRNHRISLLAMGVVAGALGILPSLVWASGAMFAVFFAILVPLAIWIYTYVFAFASLWYAHFCLTALHTLRSNAASDGVQPSLHAAPLGAALEDR